MATALCTKISLIKISKHSIHKNRSIYIYILQCVYVCCLSKYSFTLVLIKLVYILLVKPCYVHLHRSKLHIPEKRKIKEK